jgi:hypothetical protein
MRLVLFILLVFILSSCGTSRANYNYNLGSNIRLSRSSRLNLRMDRNNCYTNMNVNTKFYNGNFRVRIPCDLTKNKR